MKNNYTLVEDDESDDLKSTDDLCDTLEDGMEAIAKALLSSKPPTVNLPPPVVNIPKFPEFPRRATGFTAEVTERDRNGYIKSVSVKFNY